MLVPVILSGGSGTRLWPVSRKHLPKQFLALTGEDTLFQQTVARAGAIPGMAAPIVVAANDHRFLVAEQLTAMGVNGASILLEPVARNTAAAIAAATLQAMAVAADDPILLVLPADHQIGDQEAFGRAVQAALPLADDGWLVTFGIRPDHPETGFGYIHRAEALSSNGFRVDRFVEKPDLQTARGYLEDGDYDWNSGMFLFRASSYLQELAKSSADILQPVRKAFENATTDLDFVRLDQEAFSAARSDSIDYAVMESTTRAAVVPVDCKWSDVGSWMALWQSSSKDDDGNYLEGDVIALDTHQAYIRSHKRHLVAVVGLDDVIVVTTDDATLVARKQASQDVKRVVDGLRLADRSEHELHRVVRRPWGSYDSIEYGDRFQVKHIVVKPGASLSLQRHKHRAEHWIVVSGVAEVTCGERVFRLHENESTYIPQGFVHRLRNPGNEPTEVIEVQSGSYLGEDDIERLDDVYGRS